MIPKIDYELLGRAVEEYRNRGYEYVEVPWVVPPHVIRETLPVTFPYYEMSLDNLVTENKACHCRPSPQRIGGLVGSAEQGFLTMKDRLQSGKRYVGVTPCFRVEEATNIMMRQAFMKVELFAPGPEAAVMRFVSDAQEVMAILARDVFPRTEKTPEGIDLMIGDVEVGSYGERTNSSFGRWVYGTGLALPRFSVAQALASVT